MVYRSLRKEIPQTEIWPKIASQNRWGSFASTTHLMVQDAVTRGLAAVAVQARHPLQALRLCCESGTRAILNHRLAHDSPAGHYTVLVDVDECYVVLHDPSAGPSRRVPHAELLDLWQPRLPGSEILGNVLIGIAAAPEPASPCWLCHINAPAGVACPKCKGFVSLQPWKLLGCTGGTCIARMWNSICCPSCDCVFTFSVTEGGVTAWNILYAPADSNTANAAQADAKPASSPAGTPFNMSAVFAELDKLVALMLSNPAVANHPEVKQQLDIVNANKAKLKLAQAEALVNQAATRERLSKLEQMSKQNGEAHRQRTEKAGTPSTALDGDALGRALMKNLGFTR